jgi:hypothetical protein
MRLLTLVLLGIATPAVAGTTSYPFVNDKPEAASAYAKTPSTRATVVCRRTGYVTQRSASIKACLPTSAWEQIDREENADYRVSLREQLTSIAAIKAIR